MERLGFPLMITDRTNLTLPGSLSCLRQLLSKFNFAYIFEFIFRPLTNDAIEEDADEPKE